MIARVLAVLFVTTVALAAQSQPPTPTSTPDRQDQQGQGGREGDPASRVNQPPQSNTPAADQSPADGNAAERREQGNEAEDQTPAQWWTLTPAVISAISAAVSAIFAVLIWIVYRGQWQTMALQAHYMRDGMVETAKAANAARRGANAQRQQLRLLYAPCIDLRNPRSVMLGVDGLQKDCGLILMFDHPDSVRATDEADDSTHLRITWEIFNAGSTPIQFRGVTAKARTKGLVGWHLNPSSARTIRGGEGFDYPVYVHRLIGRDQLLFCQHRLIVSLHIEMEVHDPVERKVAHYTCRRSVICGPTRPPEITPLGDISDWPTAKGEAI